MIADNRELVSQPAHHRMLLVSSPRTASNLLLKVLDLPRQPNVITHKHGGYCLWDLYINALNNGCLFKPVDQWTEEQKAGWQQDYQTCKTRMEEYSAQAESDGKVFVTKEHASWLLRPSVAVGHMEDQGDDAGLLLPGQVSGDSTFTPNNITIFPDEYLRTWQMVFVIRHPALAFPSYHRAMTKMDNKDLMRLDMMERNMTVNMTLRWARMLYDWSLEQGNTPYLLDAHDIITNPAVLVRFCELTGLDATKLQFEWNQKADDVPPSDLNGNPPDDEQRAKIMLSTLLGSSGIIKEKAPENVDMAAELEKWKVEFGDEVAAMMARAVQESMPHYEYLKAKRLRVNGI